MPGDAHVHGSRPASSASDTFGIRIAFLKGSFSVSRIRGRSMNPFAYPAYQAFSDLMLPLRHGAALSITRSPPGAVGRDASGP